ncbi:hypothetical protein [uncultured Cellulomonas sp.]|uniref:hypothetical protein n=1 Tax=uncultured Cellulomonas sp. TaxID=189682 RepID=UPI0026143EA4|nr:hypothetical protein [uncultured Cellulomonas sp.]
MTPGAGLAAARAAKERLRARLADDDGVCGVGLARCGDGYELQVAVTGDDVRAAVPPAVDGVPVRVRVTGALHAQALPPPAPRPHGAELLRHRRR